MTTFVHTYPPDPCRVKSVSGTLSITWDDATTTTVPVSGHFHDGSSTLILKGTASADSTRYPTDPMKTVLNNFPPSPCNAATNDITGTFTVTE